MIAVESRWLGTDHRQVAQCIVVKWIHTQQIARSKSCTIDGLELGDASDRVFSV